MATKTLTKEQWKRFDDAVWRNAGLPERLLIDGYNVDVQLSMNRKRMKIQYELFINGQWKGEWFIEEENEIGNKFFPKKTFYYRTHAEAKKIEKAIGKRTAKKLNLVPQTFQRPWPYYTSFRTLKNTLEKNNDSIEWIKEDIQLSSDTANANHNCKEEEAA